MVIYTRMTEHKYNYEPSMQPREQGQARIKQNNSQRRQIELMCEVNRCLGERPVLAYRYSHVSSCNQAITKPILIIYVY